MPKIITHKHPKIWGQFLAEIKKMGILKKIFISYVWYADADTEKNANLRHWLETIRDDLTNAGLTVFLNLNSLSGESDPKLLENLQTTDVALFIATPHYFRHIQNQETRAAGELKILLARTANTADPLQLLPILYEGPLTGALPESLKKYQIQDVQDTDEYENQVIRRSSPPGLLPQILRVDLARSKPYSDLLERYRWSTFTHLPPLTPHFIDREGGISTLDCQFKEVKKNAIYGLGGVGKSTLALAYAYKNQKKYIFCYWLPSKTEEQLVLNLRILAIQLGIEVESEKSQTQAVWIHELYKRLSKIKSWLLIFDNAEDALIINPYLPPQQTSEQHILITSRQPGWPNEIFLDALNKIEAAIYFKKRFSLQQSESIPQLTEELGTLPLALTQAAAYLEVSQIGRLSYLSLLNQINTHPIFLQLITKYRDEDQDEDQKNPYIAGVAKTLLISLENLKTQAPETLALLIALSHLATDDISLELLKKIIGCSKSLSDSLTLLSRYSLIGQSAYFNHITVHRLVKVMIQNLLHINYFFAGAQNIILKMLRGGIENYYTWEECTESRKTRVIRSVNLLAHLKALIDYYNKQRSSEAPKKRMKAQKSAALGELTQQSTRLTELDRSDEFYFLEVLADVYRILGNVAEQKKLLEEVLEFHKHQYSQINMVRILINFANLLRNLESEDEFRTREIALLEQALEIEQSGSPQNQKKIAEVLASLAVSYAEINDLVKSQALFEQALALRESYQSQDHIEIANSFASLSKIYYSLAVKDLSGEHAQTYLMQAQRLIGKTLAIKRFYYGSNHPKLIFTLLELSDIEISLKQLSASKLTLKCALKIGLIYYAPDHQGLVCVLVKLAAVYELEDNIIRAVDFLKRAHFINQLNYQCPQKKQLPVLIKLGSAYKKLGKLPEYLTCLNQVQEIEDMNPQISWEKRVETVKALALTCRELNNTRQQAQVLQKFIDGLHFFTIPENVKLSLHSELADAYGNLEEFYQQSLSLAAMLSIVKEMPNSMLDVSIIIFKLAQAEEKLGLSKQACEKYQEAYERFLLVLGPEHENTKAAHAAWINLFNLFPPEDRLRALTPGSAADATLEIMIQMERERGNGLLTSEMEGDPFFLPLKPTIGPPEKESDKGNPAGAADGAADGQQQLLNFFDLDALDALANSYSPLAFLP